MIEIGPELAGIMNIALGAIVVIAFFYFISK